MAALFEFVSAKRSPVLPEIMLYVMSPQLLYVSTSKPANDAPATVFCTEFSGMLRSNSLKKDGGSFESCTSMVNSCDAEPPLPSEI